MISRRAYLIITRVAKWPSSKDCFLECDEISERMEARLRDLSSPPLKKREMNSCGIDSY